MAKRVNEMTRERLATSAALTEMHSLVAGRPTQIEAPISLRAYELYVAGGRKPGRELDDWLRGEMAAVRQRINTLAM